MPDWLSPSLLFAGWCPNHQGWHGLIIYIIIIIITTVGMLLNYYLEAKVISRFPLSPMRAGTMMNSSGKDTKTAQY